LFTDKPVVVVEVLSDSTRRLDVGEKRDAYLSIPSLKVLMIIDPARVYVNVDRRKPLGGFAQEEYRQLDQRIDLPEIEASLPVSDIYEGISLP
jgi:Uma2 family endonuclease